MLPYTRCKPGCACAIVSSLMSCTGSADHIIAVVTSRDAVRVLFVRWGGTLRLLIAALHHRFSSRDSDSDASANAETDRRRQPGPGQPPLPAEVIQLAPRRKLPARTPVKLRTLTEIVGRVESPPDPTSLAPVPASPVGPSRRRAICAEPAQLISTIQRSRQRLI